jgi:predicted RNA binding protein YcfA (HicA-like mRNA interferase family)
VSARLPVVSGAELIKALEHQGWQVARQRGSHVRLKHPERGRPLTVPLHKEIRRKTLAGILKDAGITAGELRKLL